MGTDTTSATAQTQRPAADREHQVFRDLLRRADIELDGHRPWKIQVLNPGTYVRALPQGSRGLGES